MIAYFLRHETRNPLLNSLVSYACITSITPMMHCLCNGKRNVYRQNIQTTVSVHYELL